MPLLIAAFQKLLKTLSRTSAKNMTTIVASGAGMVACGPACAYFAGTLAGMLLDCLYESADNEQRAAEREERLKKLLLELDFQKGMRRLEELNAIRAQNSAASLADARTLLTEARGFFLNASSVSEFPLLSVRADCYVGSCNALLRQDDLHNYERAYATCVRLENSYVMQPPGSSLTRPDFMTSITSKATCAIYTRRVFLWSVRLSTQDFTDAYKKPIELYDHMAPVSSLLKARASQAKNIVPAEDCNYDRYLALYAEAHEKAMNCARYK